MKTNYCLPIIRNTKNEVLETIEKYRAEYAFFEVWLDYIEDLSADFIDTLIKGNEKRIIVLFRRKNLEKPTMTPTLQNAIIENLVNKHMLLDVDVENQRDILDYIQENKLFVRLITSFHEYTHTPTNQILQAVLDKMKGYTPLIYKISTYCKEKEDSIRLLKLLLTLKKENKRCIMLGMGEHGIMTRIFGTLWGNEMIFAPQTTSESSALGQLTKEQLESIFDIIDIKSEARNPKSETNSKFKNTK